MSSKSSSRAGRDLLPVGRVAGHRGRAGELTVKVFGGDAEHWTGLGEVWIGSRDGAEGRFRRIENSRGYRDRLVLKLEGVDDAQAAEALRGRQVMARETDAPRLPEGEYYFAKLIGMEVRDEAGGLIGTVTDVVSAGGSALLVVRRGTAGETAGEAEEILIPLAREIVLEVRDDERRMTVRPPEGLLELNRPGSE